MTSFEKRIGSRAEVLHGTAQQTAGGLKKKDLFVNTKDGRIKSKDAVKAAKDRLKREGAAHFVKVFKPKKAGFGLQPKQGTKAYDKKLARFEKKQEKI
jgi:hypothetical protein